MDNVIKHCKIIPLSLLGLPKKNRLSPLAWPS